MAMTKSGGPSRPLLAQSPLGVVTEAFPLRTTPSALCDRVASEKWHRPHMLRTREVRDGVQAV